MITDWLEVIKPSLPQRRALYRFSIPRKVVHRLTRDQASRLLDLLIQFAVEDAGSAGREPITGSGTFTEANPVRRAEL